MDVVRFQLFQQCGRPWKLSATYLSDFEQSGVAVVTFDIRWEDLKLLERLGEGQAGSVWLAILSRPTAHLPVGTRVAVKRYKRWVLEEPGQLERIYRELAASVKVHHRNVVENLCLVLDTNALPALVMKCYDGATLESLLTSDRTDGARVDVGDAFKFLGELIDGVNALHSAGILHRDLKPANILVDGSSKSPIVMDLGVVSDFLLAERTQTKDFLGTVRYAEPGYLAGGPCSPASDWYSVGLIGYELFFGKRFLGAEEHWAKIIAMKVSGSLPTATDLAKECEALTPEWGQNAAEAVFYILSTLLFHFTPQVLQSLRNAISDQFWMKPFFEQPDGQITLGEPKTIPSFQFRPKYRGDVTEPSLPRESLEEATCRLGSTFRSNSDDLREIQLTVEHGYWKWRSEGKDNIHEAESVKSIFLYAAGGGDDTEYDSFDINTGLLALHRYGYLRQLTQEPSTSATPLVSASKAPSKSRLTRRNFVAQSGTRAHVARYVCHSCGGDVQLDEDDCRQYHCRNCGAFVQWSD